MSTRILVSLDVSARATSTADSSTVSSLVDGLEAEPPHYTLALRNGVQREGRVIFSWIREHARVVIVLAIADAIEVNTFKIPTPFRYLTPDDGSIANRDAR